MVTPLAFRSIPNVHTILQMNRFSFSGVCPCRRRETERDLRF